MIALLVVEDAPPTPSIWRRSGEPKVRISRRSMSAVSAGRSLWRKIQHLLVPPRTRAAGT